MHRCAGPPTRPPITSTSFRHQCVAVVCFTPSFLGTICSYSLLIKKVSLLCTQNIVIVEQKSLTILSIHAIMLLRTTPPECWPPISTQKDFRHLSVAVVFLSAICPLESVEMRITSPLPEYRQGSSGEMQLPPTLPYRTQPPSQLP